MLGNIVRDNNSDLGKTYTEQYSGNKTLAYNGGEVVKLTGTSVPAGIYFVTGFINISNVTNNMYAQGFIEYNGGWLDAAGSYAKVGEIYQDQPSSIIVHDGSTDIRLYMSNSNTTTTNNLTIANPVIMAMRIG